MSISLCCSDWPGTPRDLPAPASQMLDFKVCTTMLPTNNIFFQSSYTDVLLFFPSWNDRRQLSLALYELYLLPQVPRQDGMCCWSMQWRLGAGVVLASLNWGMEGSVGCLVKSAHCNCVKALCTRPLCWICTLESGKLVIMRLLDLDYHKYLGGGVFLSCFFRKKNRSAQSTALSGLELPTYTRLSSNLQSSICLCLPCAKIKVMPPHWAWIFVFNL